MMGEMLVKNVFETVKRMGKARRIEEVNIATEVKAIKDEKSENHN